MAVLKRPVQVLNRWLVENELEINGEKDALVRLLDAEGKRPRLITTSEGRTRGIALPAEH